jgi:GTP-binding protein
MVPVTSEDIIKEYKILLHELEQYNPELLTKARILAITKIDALDAKELQKKKASKKLQKLDLPIVFISSVAGEGIDELKDALWTELNKEQNQVIEISHAPIDVTVIERSEADSQDSEDEEQGTIYLNEVEEEWDLDKYKGIGWDE